MLKATEAIRRFAVSAGSTAFWVANEKRTNANSPPWASAKAKSIPSADEVKDSTKDEEDNEFQREKSRDDGGDGPRPLRDQREVDAGPDRDKKQPEEQAFERLDVRFELNAIFAFGQNNAGHERAERGGEAELLHEQRNSEHDEERRRREHFAQPRIGDITKERPEDETTCQNNDGHRGDNDKPPLPTAEIADHSGFRRARAGPDREQWHQRQDRNDGDILEQEDRERGLAAGCLHHAAFLERLEHDRGRRHGQDQADGDGRFPCEAGRDRHRPNYDRCSGHLQPAQAKDRPAHLPQERRAQFQTDHEQHHDHADLGEMHDVAAALDEPQRMRPDNRAGSQVAND